MRLAVSLSSVLLLSGCFSEPLTSSPDGTTDDGPQASTSTSGNGATSAAGKTTSTDPSDTTTTAADAGSGDGSSDSSTGGSTSGLDESSSTGEPFSVCPSFIDDFEDGREDSVWQQAPSSASIEEDGEWKLQVSAAGEDIFATMTIPVPTSFEGAAVRFEVGTPPADDDVLLILWLQQAGGQGRVAFNLIQRDGLLELQARVTNESGPPGFVVDTAPWSQDVQRWMQLREADGVLYFETSSSGRDFTPVFELETPIDVENVWVGVVGHNREDLPEDVEVSIRTFELRCG